MKESVGTMLRRHLFNLFPAYRGTGARITHIEGDWREIRIELPLNWRTRNYVGTIYGGSMYGAVDPLFMLMLIKNLGPEFVVWDKAGSIDFVKPGRGTLYANAAIERGEIEEIRNLLKVEKSVVRTYAVDLVDTDRNVCVSVEKVLYIRRKLPTES